MALLPPFRGQGIGTGLIRPALAAAKAFGFHRVELTVRKNNAGAIELYKKVGFETEGVQHHAVHVDGMYEDLILMAVLF
jgi:RimJ/RimL family protein N-acetyltransferase